MELFANLSAIVMKKLLDTREQIVSGFNPPDPSLYPDLNVPIVANSALFTTCVYFSLLAVLNKIGPLLSNYRVVASLMQFSFQTIPTLLFLLQINPRGFTAFIYNSLPHWARPYIISASDGFMPEPHFSIGPILVFVVLFTAAATLLVSSVWLLTNLLVFRLFSKSESVATSKEAPSTATPASAPPVSHSQTIILNSLSGSSAGSASNSVFNTLAYAQAHFVAYATEFATDPQKVVYLANKLQGHFRDWFSAASVRDPSLLHDYDHFVRSLLSFSGEDDEEIGPPANRFLECVQGSSSLGEYNKRFRALQARLQASQAEACDFYKLGLDPDLQAFLSHHELPTDLDTLIREVVKWNRRRVASLTARSKGQLHTVTTLPTSQPSQGARNPIPTLATSSNSTPQMQIPPGTEPKEGGGYKLTAEEVLRRRTLNLCSYCGSSGHSVAGCTNPRRIARETPSGPTVNHLSSSTSPACPIISITVHGQNSSVTTWALLDTGAESNFLDSSISDRLQFTKKDLIVARAANGAPVHSNRLEDRVLFDIDGSPFFSEFIAAKGLSFPVILGYPWWKEARANLSHLSNSLVFFNQDKEKSIPLQPGQPRNVEHWQLSN